jgi:hypothetical protein
MLALILKIAFSMIQTDVSTSRALGVKPERSRKRINKSLLFFHQLIVLLVDAASIANHLTGNKIPCA